MDASTARILIVDDHPMMRRGVADLLADEPDLTVCSEAGDAEEALRLFAEHRPDLVIVDLALPGEGGLRLIQRLKALNSRVKLLVLSMHDEVLYAERALRAGAGGYVKKSAHSDELLDAIRRVLKGSMYVSQELNERIVARMTGEHAAQKSGIEALTTRELEILELIGQGLRTGEIAARLLLSVKTVERHRENIKAKLGLKSASELIRFAMNWAYGS